MKVLLNQIKFPKSKSSESSRFHNEFHSVCDLSTGLPSGYCNILLMHSYLNEKAFRNLAVLPDYVDGHSVSLRMQSECGKMQEKCGPEKIRIRTLFTQCNFKYNYRIKILNIKLIFLLLTPLRY